MARLVVGAVFGVVVGVLAGAALDLSAEDDEIPHATSGSRGDPSDDVAVAAAEHGIDELLLRGAVNTTGLEPRTYLCMTGEGPCPKPQQIIPALFPASSRVDCVIWHESRGNPNARNPRSGASGLGQFLPSTWRTTPYASYSIFDPVANRAAVAWMLNVGRAREFEVITLGLC